MAKKNDDKTPKEGKPRQSKKATDVDEDFRYIVRIVNTDLDGEKQVGIALPYIKGIGNRLADVIIRRAEVPPKVKIGTLDDEQIERLKEEIENIVDSIPGWLMNKRRDMYTGEDTHLYGSEIETRKREDINLLKKIRCYRGIRHESGQKVRGQRTRSNGRSGLTLGVSRKRP